MDAQTLINKIYLSFSCFDKPEHCTSYTHCEECKEHDQTLCSKTRETLSIEDIGTVYWGTVPYMTAEAMVYFLPG